MAEKVVNSSVAPRMFELFEEICKIPHGSENEAQIAEYIADFARKRGLYVYKDRANNVLVRKPATSGRENEPAILLQGHTDMVCEKDGDVEHDFLKDGLKLYVDGEGFLRAKGTTLGADDGVAVAIMLAVLDGEIGSHPAIECLFTAGEEIGMVGAGQFDFSLIDARKMINIDSETEGKAVVGCAGGVRSELLLPLGRSEKNGEGLRITVGGLHGGHSGEDINKGRANANRIMGRLLTELSFKVDFGVISINGGSKDNAIPRECTAEICVENFYEALLEIEEIAKIISRELCSDDGGFFCKADHCDTAPVIEKQSIERLLLAVNNTPCGIMEMSNDVEGLVEWSANLGVVATCNNEAKLTMLTRSSIDERIDYSIHRLDRFAEALGGSIGHFGRYTGWSYAKESPVRDAYKTAYKALFSKDAGEEIIHAGLECGLVRANIPDMDIISIGPDIIALHSPGEKLNIASAERLWTLLEYMLKN